MDCQYCGTTLKEHSLSRNSILTMDQDEEGESAVIIASSGACDICGTRSREDHKLEMENLDYHDYYAQLVGEGFDPSRGDIGSF